jgi:hypothetical protein
VSLSKGKAESRALTNTLSPSTLEIVLKGLRTLKALRPLRLNPLYLLPEVSTSVKAYYIMEK